MKLSSIAFRNNNKIPEKYTCDSQGISPPLEISDIPKEARSLVLIMEDPDIPDFVKEKFKIDIWDHWVIFNIPSNTTKIEESKNPKGVLGLNTSKKLSYQSPCPPDKEHRYFFKLFALNSLLNLKEGSTKKQVEESMKNNIISQAVLIGTYGRNKQKQQ